MSKKEFIFELYYHVGKLQNSLMTDDLNNTKQFAGDILNVIGFLLDTINKNLL